MPVRLPACRPRALAAVVSVAALPFGAVVLAPSAHAAPDPTPPAGPAPTVLTLTAKPGERVEAGRALRLRVRVAPQVAGTVRLTDAGKGVAAAKVKDGVAIFELTAKRGEHPYAAAFTPKHPDRYAASVTTTHLVRGVAAQRLPLRKGAYGPLVRKTQHQLSWAGVLVRASGTYDGRTIAAVKRFQGKFFLPQSGIVNKRTAAELRELKLKRLPNACRSVSRAICIDKTRKVAQLVVGGKVKISLDARFGSTSSPALQTREGIFSIQRKAVSHISSLYRTSMPYSMFFSGGQAVHYSQYFAADGYSGASHGCVNIRDMAGIKKMYAQAPLGTRVYVYRS